MDRLDEFLARAAAADGLTRMEHRNGIAAFGEEAVRRLEPWLADARLGPFAVLTIERAAREHAALAQARVALHRARSQSSDTVRGDIEAALTRLGGRRAATARRPGRFPVGPRASRNGVPPALEAIVTAWIALDKPQQPARDWHQADWLTAFPQYDDVLSNLPPKIDRAAIRPACADVTRDTDAAERALVAVMAWGAIDFGYRCKWTRDILSTPRAGERLLAAARTLAADGPLAAYRRLQDGGDCNLYRLGESFGSKFMYFCQPDGQTAQALILDSLVDDWLRRYAGLAFSSGRWSEIDYAAYLQEHARLGRRAWLRARRSGVLHLPGDGGRAR